MWFTFQYAAMGGVVGAWLQEWAPLLGFVVGCCLVGLFVPMLIRVFKEVTYTGTSQVSWGSWGSSNAFGGAAKGVIGRMDFSEGKFDERYAGASSPSGLDPEIVQIYQDLEYYQSSDTDFEELADVYYGLNEVRPTDSDAATAGKDDA